MSQTSGTGKRPSSSSKGLSVQITTINTNNPAGGKKEDPPQNSQTTFKPTPNKPTQFYPQRPKQPFPSTSNAVPSANTGAPAKAQGSRTSIPQAQPIALANSAHNSNPSASASTSTSTSTNPSPATNIVASATSNVAINTTPADDAEHRKLTHRDLSAISSKGFAPAASKTAPEPVPSERIPDDHPLHNEWCVFFDYPHKKMTAEIWKQNVKHVATINSVENFWRLHNNMQDITQLQNGSNFHFFKKDIFPEWEDPANANGGKWVHVIPPTDRVHMNNKWMRLLMSCIGEMFEHSDEVCGCVLNVRTRDSRIALWIRESKNTQVVLSIGKQLREFMNLGEGETIRFSPHGSESDAALSLEL